MRTIVAISQLVLFTILVGCGSGKSGAGGSVKEPPAPPEVAIPTVSFSESQLNLAGSHEPNVIDSASISVTFSGEGLSVVWPEYEEGLYSRIDYVSSTEAVITFSYPSQALPPGEHIAVARITTVAVGHADTFKELTLNIKQADSLHVINIQRPLEPYSTNIGRFSLITAAMRWELSASPWILLQKASGSGSAAIEFGYDLTLAELGLNNGVINITATDDAGQTIIRTIELQVNVDNDLQISSHSVSSETIFWGDVVAPIVLSIDTYVQDWSLTSDNAAVTLDQTSGAGSTTVAASVDSSKLEVGTHAISVTATSGDVQATTTFNIEIAQPSLVDEQSYPYNPMLLYKDIVNPGTEKELQFHLSNGARAPVRATMLSERLSVRSADGLTGTPLVIQPNSNARDEGHFFEEVEFTIDIPGAPIRVMVPVRLHIDHFGLDPLRHAYAFADYATSDIHQAEIEFRNSQVLLEQGVVELLQATSDKEWVVVDKASVTGLSFHLQTDSLADGFHLASLDIAHPDHPLIRPARVYIGYYKSQHPIEAKLQTYPDPQSVVTPSPVGPWTYLASIQGRTVRVYNNHSGLFESNIEFDTASRIDKILVTDDGKFLAISDGSQNRLYFYDLMMNEHAGYWEGFIGGDIAAFHRVNGVPFLFAHNWYEINSQSIGGPNMPIVEQSNSSLLNGFGLYGFAVPTGSGVLAASIHLCGIEYGMLDYRRSSNTLTFGTSQPAIGGCTSIQPAVSPDGKYLLHYNERDGEITRFGISLDGTLTVQARTTLEPGLGVRRLALTNSGKALMEVYFDGSVSVRVYDAQFTHYDQPYSSGGRNIGLSGGLSLSADGQIGMFVELEQDTGAYSITTFPVGH